MARGKTSVQLYDHVGDVLTRVLDDRLNGAVAAVDDKKTEKQCIATANPDLGEHIADQLRVAYAELLGAPVPDHLKKLLADLCKVEGKS